MSELTAKLEERTRNWDRDAQVGLYSVERLFPMSFPFTTKPSDEMTTLPRGEPVSALEDVAMNDISVGTTSDS